MCVAVIPVRLGRMDQTAPDDATVVAAMTAGDPAGLDSAYRRYADRLYTYARPIVGEDAAADVVQETFLIAQERVRQLRDPSRLGSWLYAITRNECLRRVRARRRTVTLAESHEPVLDTDPGRAIHAAQIRDLVHAAAAGLNDSEREVFELTVRHGLSPTEIADVLGVPANHAHARISRARTQFENALGALMLARDGGGQCAALARLLDGWDGQLTVLLRKRIERHARDCAVCADRRRDRMNPSSLLAAYGAPPFLAMTQHLTARATRTASASTPGRDRSSTLRRVSASTIGAIAVVVLIVAGVHVAGSKPESMATALPTSPPSVAVSAAPPENLAPPGDRSSTTPHERGSATPEGSTTVVATVVVIPFTAQAAARTTCSSGPTFALVVGVETHGATLVSARLYWRISATAVASMTVSGSTARRTVNIAAAQVSWWVVATAADGRTATTPQVTAANSCH
jgi:RNA polymerase sigma factor (sigma-70 family)